MEHPRSGSFPCRPAPTGAHRPDRADLVSPPEPRGIRPPKTPNSDRRRPPTSPNMCESCTQEMPFPGQVIGPSQVPISPHLRASSRRGTLRSTNLLRLPRTEEASPSGDGEARDEVPPRTGEASTMRIEMPEKRKKYDREFREGAVRIVEETGKPIAQVARDLGVVEGTLGTWVKQARESRDGSSSLSRDDYAELQRLRGEVAELRMERDVLKRSVVLWVKEATK